MSNQSEQIAPLPADEVAVSAQNISMSFNMASEQLNSLKEYFIKIFKHELFFKEFIALNDVSFSIKKGEVCGLVGTNGSGKSTLLKIIAGVLEPSKGTCTIQGSIAPLIELGAGFDMELTARENIYLNGSLLGYSKIYIDEHFDDIVEFAELRDFLDLPMKNYSSGMVARIAFAIATVIVPDILIVDEALSVGDVFFQEKCERRINSLINDHHTTVLFVSHSIAQVERICDRAIWIEKGHKVMEGEVTEVCSAYRNMEYLDFVEAHGIMEKSGDYTDPNEEITIGEVALALYHCSKEGASLPSDARDAENKAFTWLREEFFAQTPDIPYPGSKGDPLTREELAYLLHLFSLKRRPSLTSYTETALGAFSDAALVSTYAKTALAWCVSRGLIQGMPAEDGSRIVAPHETAKRITAAKMITKVFRTVFSYPDDVSPTANFVTPGYYDYVIENSIMGGYASGLYGPDDGVTRGQVYTVLWRCAGRPDTTASVVFDDVSKDEFFFAPVAWATSNGILDAMGERFEAEEPVNKDEMAQLITRFASHKSGVDFSRIASSADAACKDCDGMDEPAITAIAWCISRGYLPAETSNAGMMFGPKSIVTRADMTRIATLLATS